MSSELTGIETRSPSSVTPQRHFAQATGSFRAWLRSEQWETAPHFMYITVVSQRGLPKAVTLPCTYCSNHHPPYAALAQAALCGCLRLLSTPLLSPWAQVLEQLGRPRTRTQKGASARLSCKPWQHPAVQEEEQGQPRNSQVPLVLIFPLVEYLGFF